MEIKTVISITIEAFALLISLLISIFQIINKRREQKDRIILRMVILTGILLFSDIFAYGYRGNSSQTGWFIVRISNLIVYITNYVMLIAYGMCLCIYTKSDSKIQLIHFKVVCMMAFASIVMVFVSQFSDFLYYFDVENYYNRGEMFILTQVAPVLGGAIYIGILVMNRTKIQRNEGIALSVYLAMPYIATIFQIFVYGYPAQTVAVVIGCWGLFLAREIEINNQLEYTVKQEMEKQDKLDQAITTIKEQYAVLKSMSEIYYSMHLIDLTEDTVKELNSQNEVQDVVNQTFGATKMMVDIISLATTEDYKEDALRFTDLTTLADRMQNKKAISGEFVGNRLGWYRAGFITIETDSHNKPTKVVFTTQDIDEEKRQRNMLIHKSRTDELTRFYNRRAYEEDIEKYKNGFIEENFVYICFDVNSLKKANDTLGHAAGDELIIGAGECMKKAFGKFGKLYRTGGDEFIFIGTIEEEQMKKTLYSFEEITENWSGSLVHSLSVSYGVVTKKGSPDLSIDEIALIADQRMYLSKREYYQKMN